ncbi:MAG TPA: hypothetical protein PLL30_15075 [Candidatus Krumholzibacteria bacterium]|nr:hypothetical protein [Candidatus Krumholzibacteria bacterium]HPD73092.1 hypothetical protein [Candidatus Krumholzibacteria bacterium]HRY41892.1 hypothetical protein [Candidatus Krumholzibacteria bacterium]
MTRARARLRPRLIALGAAVLLASGCARLDSMPTRPDAAPGPAGPWQQIYPEFANEHLTSVWGMDADDMWAGGEYGVLLHYDGRRAARFDLEPRRGIVAIDGLASAAVWAVTWSHLHRWDGLAWTAIAATPFEAMDLCVIAEDEIYIGGQAWADTSYVPTIARYDGVDWTRMDLPDGGPDGVFERVDAVWRPSAAHPVMAATQSLVFRLRHGAWETVASSVRVVDVDGDLGLVRSPYDQSCRLVEFTAAGELSYPCDQTPVTSGRFVLDSRFPVVGSSSSLCALVDCESHPLVTLPQEILDWAIPRRPGAMGPAVFGVGRDASFVRGAWQADGSFTCQSVLAGVSLQPSSRLAGDADRIYASAGSNLIIGDQDGWHAEDVWFGIDQIEPLATGDVVVIGGRELAVRSVDGRLTALPSLPRWADRIWSDGTNAWAAADRLLWRLADGVWTPADSLAGWVHWLDTNDASEVYLLTQGRLFHHDGEQLRDLTERPELNLDQCYLAPLSDRLFVRGYIMEDPYWRSYEAVFADGRWSEFPAGLYWWEDSICEVSSDLVIAFGYEFARFGPDGWELLDGFDRPDGTSVNALWGHPDRGLVVLTGSDRIFRRDLSGSAAAKR